MCDTRSRINTTLRTPESAEQDVASFRIGETTTADAYCEQNGYFVY